MRHRLVKNLNKAKRASQVFVITYSYLTFARRREAPNVSLKRAWARHILRHLNVNLKIKGTLPPSEGPWVLVGNHLSYLDIPVLVMAVPELSFLGKSEIARWPLIGKGAKAMDTIFVNRKSGSSREQARKDVTRKLRRKRSKLCIFPSGTTSLNESPRWNKGAFEIAKTCPCHIIPFRLTYQPLESIAYIDRDIFLTHLFHLVGLDSIDVTIEFGTPSLVDDPMIVTRNTKEWSEATHGNSL
ncbi:MAG: 1-acyl-sn-glycerol-3-phosphate acyltransferase [Bdellovibrionales bacterium]|nr:1-acyl-sn-glycerol-3-phosphate acyltransferase [Bdellovibrionales bacterium]